MSDDKTIPASVLASERKKWRDKSDTLQKQINDLQKQLNDANAKRRIGIEELFDKIKTTDLSGEETNIKSLLIEADKKLKEENEKLLKDIATFESQKSQWDDKIKTVKDKDRHIRLEDKAKQFGLDVETLKTEVGDDEDEAAEDKVILRLISEGKAKLGSTTQTGSQTFERGQAQMIPAKSPKDMDDKDFDAHWERQKQDALAKT